MKRVEGILGNWVSGRRATMMHAKLFEVPVEAMPLWECALALRAHSVAVCVVIVRIVESGRPH